MDLVIEWIREGVGFIPPAAAAFRRSNARVREEFGRDIDVNSTYRSWDTQMAMHLASVAYQAGRGPYPGHSWATHPSQSFHVAGTALDSDDWVHARIVEILAENGFIRNRLYVTGEEHHFEWLRDRDRHYGQPELAGVTSRPLVPSRKKRGTMNEEYYRNATTGDVGMFAVGVKVFRPDDYKRFRVIRLNHRKQHPEIPVVIPPVLNAKTMVNLSPDDWATMVAIHGGTF